MTYFVGCVSLAVTCTGFNTDDDAMTYIRKFRWKLTRASERAEACIRRESFSASVYENKLTLSPTKFRSEEYARVRARGWINCNVKKVAPGSLRGAITLARTVSYR